LELKINKIPRSVIDSFQGEYRFLSNFWPSEIEYDGFLFPTVEHAYQYSKFDNDAICDEIREANSPGEAKRLARKYKNFIRPCFHIAKQSVMQTLLQCKFRIPELQKLLLDTGDAKLIEGNTWNDTYWGVCNGVGENHLGILLMDIRYDLQCALGLR